MKKKTVIILSIICIIAGGYFTMEYLKQKEEEEKFWKVQEARVEKYIRYNIQDVKSITFTEKSVSPMGVPRLKGYINNNKELDFIARISTTENFEGQFTRSGKLGKLIKDPEKSVSEIEKEEKEKHQE
ncbi:MULTISPECIES: DUF1433 domain-containing protein [Bacillus]|uniref:DUF1433 domain-containing protein n=1 Tax=Bacillus TaxID=1386 RepID=UPI0003313829|nr:MULTISPECIES: DUF1433 domain-containing protein [Bacillus cereus group]EOP11876.1 hypothetical protein ICS_02382 [Bacillus cereus BAG2O-3]EOQ10901.1 hypothetical protein KQ3_02505 [Bacillus cereus B5-2]EOQ28921.1 hypothetical protein KQ1_03172 [Bacillus cereus BAG3O-1]MDA1604120.1 DUF1433 domain-containing protein [Bacillus cereus]PFW60225.1 DUF1433 domain-containing protein [Bacillus sp. AFS075960]RFB15578.1 DUF1433 domain-containing protein [Bacillus sp. OE]RFB46309.1 DUF1433 domain-con